MAFDAISNALNTGRPSNTEEIKSEEDDDDVNEPDLLEKSRPVMLVFGDGIRRLFKVPFRGHRQCWDGVAVRALTTEALTMRFGTKEWMTNSQGICL